MVGRPSSGVLQAKNDHCRELGVLFRTARERAEISLTHLSKSTGLHVLMLRYHEAGYLMLRTDHLEHAAGIIGVDPAALLIRGGRNGRHTVDD